MLSGGILLGLAATAVRGGHEKASLKTQPICLVVDDKPVARDGKAGVSFAPLVKKVAPSVVKVFTTAKAKPGTQLELPGFELPRPFFGEPGRTPKFKMPPQHGVGSGVIVTEDGYILTNNHVVDGADEVKVTLADGREFTAKVVGKDPKSDVAVAKIDAKGLPFLHMADSDQIEVGDVVLAIGNPFGIGQTVTSGIVSATGRATLGLDYEDFIQTDAAINPGNSGGALVDTEGRLVGINTAILSRSGGNQGIGFAIPTNLARDVMESLVKDGKVTRGYLGVTIQDVTPALAKEFKLKETEGALVADVVPKGPADKAGLQSGDVVLRFDGKAVRDSRHLKFQVARTKPGESVPVKVLRDGSTRELDVKVKELPSNQLAEAASDTNDTETLKGVAVSDLDENARGQFKVPANIKGALVTGVEEGSAAGEAGLKPGDVIMEINRKPVRSAEDAIKLTETARDGTTLVRVWSKGTSHYLIVNETKEG
jgi:serine protease Do